MYAGLAVAMSLHRKKARRRACRVWFVLKAVLPGRHTGEGGVKEGLQNPLRSGAGYLGEYGTRRLLVPIAGLGTKRLQRAVSFQWQ